MSRHKICWMRRRHDEMTRIEKRERKIFYSSFFTMWFLFRMKRMSSFVQSLTDRPTYLPTQILTQKRSCLHFCCPHSLLLVVVRRILFFVIISTTTSSSSLSTSFFRFFFSSSLFFLLLFSLYGQNQNKYY